MFDQVHSFQRIFCKTLKITNTKYDLVFASSSKLLQHIWFSNCKKTEYTLYLDIRDIFVDTMDDVLKSKLVKTAVLPFLKAIEKRTFSYATHINLISRV